MSNEITVTVTVAELDILIQALSQLGVRVDQAAPLVALRQRLMERFAQNERDDDL